MFTLKSVMDLCMQTRFRRNPQVYESFLDILRMYKNDHKSVKELHQTVCVLGLSMAFTFLLIL